MLRVTLALIGLPVVALLLAVACLLPFSLATGGSLEALLNARFQALWYVLYSYFAIFVVALPSLAIAWRLRWLRWWHAILAGALAGTAVFVPVLVPTLFDETLRLGYRLEELSSLGSPAAMGAAHGALFWLLALWRNPFVEARIHNEPRVGNAS